MKTIYNFLYAFTILFVCAACNNEWEDELYKEMVSFGKNGVTDVYIKYNPGGNTSYKVPIMISGSQFNNQDYHVKIALDTDTLDRMNFERFRYREDLYFKLLEDNFYDMPSEVIIPKNEGKGTLTIDFSLDNLDLVEKYILPLTIVDDPAYQTNLRKHYRKSLLHIIPFNDYSGTYSATDGLITDRKGIQKQPITMDTREMFVVDENSIFFYAGATEEDAEDRSRYKVIVKFCPSESNPNEGTLDIMAPNGDEINFKPYTCSYTIVTQMDEQLPYLEHKFITLIMEYDYDQITSGGVRLEYNFKGSLILERKRNTLIPDEDQQIMW